MLPIERGVTLAPRVRGAPAWLLFTNPLFGDGGVVLLADSGGALYPDGGSTPDADDFTVSVSLFALSPQPQRLGDLRAGETDTRYASLYLDLTTPAVTADDPIVSITSVTVARADGDAMDSGDLAITPAGKAAPWLDSTGYIVNWWEGAGASIAAEGPVDYVVTVTATTTSGRTVIRDLLQRVVATLG